KRVVRSDTRTEKQRRLAAQRHRQTRQETRASEVNPMLTESGRTNIAVGVKHGKHPPIFQDTRALFGRSPGSRHVEFSFDTDFNQWGLRLEPIQFLPYVEESFRKARDSANSSSSR